MTSNQAIQSIMQILNLKNQILKIMNNENWDCIVNFPIKKEKQLPKTWKEFCDNWPLKCNEAIIDSEDCTVYYRFSDYKEPTPRNVQTDLLTLPDRATAWAILALCQLIQLRNAYNGDWVPDWLDNYQTKYVIYFKKKCITSADTTIYCEILYFKTAELRDEFLRNFRPLIEKLKPLYGIKNKKGGEE